MPFQGDVCVITPKDLYKAYGSRSVLKEMWESMSTWFDKGIPRGPDGLWLNPRNGFQLSDWYVQVHDKHKLKISTLHAADSRPGLIPVHRPMIRVQQ